MSSKACGIKADISVTRVCSGHTTRPAQREGACEENNEKVEKSTASLGHSWMTRGRGVPWFNAEAKHRKHTRAHGVLSRFVSVA